jgi:hypothetical protein
MNEESDEAAAQAIAVQQLTGEVRALWRIVLSLLTLALVLLAVFSLVSFFSISRYERIFEDLLAGRPLPQLTKMALSFGDSVFVLGFLILAPVGSMLWLGLERARPVLPAFAMICLCVLLVLFLILVRLAIWLPSIDLLTPLGS